MSTWNPLSRLRRMAGLLLNDRVFALIEENGKTEIVQPGQMLNDGLARVARIEKDKVILKTTGTPSRYITVTMAASPKVAEAGAVEPESAAGWCYADYEAGPQGHAGRYAGHDAGRYAGWRAGRPAWQTIQDWGPSYVRDLDRNLIGSALVL